MSTVQRQVLQQGPSNAQMRWMWCITRCTLLERATVIDSGTVWEYSLQIDKFLLLREIGKRLPCKVKAPLRRCNLYNQQNSMVIHFVSIWMHGNKRARVCFSADASPHCPKWIRVNAAVTPSATIAKQMANSRAIHLLSRDHQARRRPTVRPPIIPDRAQPAPHRSPTSQTPMTIRPAIGSW